MIYSKNYKQALIWATGFASLFCECYEDSMKQGARRWSFLPVMGLILSLVYGTALD